MELAGFDLVFVLAALVVTFRGVVAEGLARVAFGPVAAAVVVERTEEAARTDDLVRAAGLAVADRVAADLVAAVLALEALPRATEPIGFAAALAETDFAVAFVVRVLVVLATAGFVPVVTLALAAVLDFAGISLLLKSSNRAWDSRLD